MAGADFRADQARHDPVRADAHYAVKALNNPEGVRLLAWSGLEYADPATDPDMIPRAQRLRRSVEEVRSLQESGRLPAGLDPE
jgi:hypothetical protein